MTLVQTIREEVDEVLLEVDEVDETGEATVVGAVEEAAGALLGFGTTLGSVEAVELAFDAEETTLEEATVGATAARASFVGVTVEENLEESAR